MACHIEKTFGKELVVLASNWSSIQLFKVDMDARRIFLMAQKGKIIWNTFRDDHR